MLSRYLIQYNEALGYSLSATVFRRYATALPQQQPNETVSTAANLENARPFKELPGPSKYEIIRGNMLGGNSFRNIKVIRGVFQSLHILVNRTLNIESEFHKKTFTETILQLSEKYGRLFHFPAMFGKPEMIIALNPADYPIIFRNEGIWPDRRPLRSFAYHRAVHRADIFQGIDGLITTSGEVWAKIRTAVNPVLMQPRNARLYLNTILEINDEFLERIRDIRDPVTNEMPDDFHDDLNRLTLEGIVGVALNTRLGMIHKNRDSLECKQLLQSIRDFFDLSEDLEVKPSIWKIVKTPKFYKLMNTLDLLTNLCNKYIDQTLKQIEVDKDGKFTSEEGKEKSVLEKLLRIDRRIAVVMALDMMMAGVDTTSSTLTGILFGIAKNPDKQQKLFEELKTIQPNKESRLTIENMQNLPYLRACIKEGMRCYPITLGTLRNLPNDVVLSGYRIPAGIDIRVSSNLLLHNEEFVKEPNKFIPERWLRNNPEGKTYHIDNPFVFLPFGFGPRSCVGKRIVDLELEVTLARLVRNFSIEFNYSTENAFKPKLVKIPGIPLKFKFDERN